MKISIVNFIACFSIFIGSISCDQQKSTVDEGENVIADDQVQYQEQEIAEGGLWEEDEIHIFMKNAGMIDKMQIKLGQMVKDRTDKDGVASLAEIIRRDHTYSLENLRKIASKMNVTISDSLDSAHQAKISKIMTVQEEFDRAFLEMMVAAHKRDLEKYNNAMKSIPATHPIKDWIDTNLPLLEQHQFTAQRLLDDETMFPARAPGQYEDPGTEEDRE